MSSISFSFYYTKIARIRSQSYLEINYSDLYQSEHLPIDVIISPEKVAEAVISRLEIPCAFEIETFLGGKAQLIGISIDRSCPVINTPLRQLSQLFIDLNAIVLGIEEMQNFLYPIQMIKYLLTTRYIFLQLLKTE